MTIKDRVTSQFSIALLWRFSMIALSVLAVILLAVLWFSGARDTKDAMGDGRRLLINLETGTIEGKQTSLENQESAIAATSPADAIATSPATQDQAATAPASVTAEATAPAAVTAATDVATKTAAATEPAAKAATETATVAANASATQTANANEPFADSSQLSDLSLSAQIKPAAVPLAEVKDFLLEKTADGNLPIIGPKNTKPWQHYAKPYSHKGHLPTIAIIVSGLGQNKAATDAALRLPENVSLSFSPYAKDLVSWGHAARVAGHEILIDLPLEPSNYPASDPGPYGLLTGKGVEENNKRLKWLMSRSEGYVGFTTPLNEAFSNNDAAFKELLDQLSARGLMMGLAREPASTDTRRILEESKDPYIIADAIIDEDLSVTAIQARLLSLEKVASKRGFAVGFAQPFPLTMQQLTVWAADLEKNGFTLVPVTFITKLKFPVS